MTVHKSDISMYDLHKKLDHISYYQINKLLETLKLIITEHITDCTETPCEDCIINNICCCRGYYQNGLFFAMLYMTVTAVFLIELLRSWTLSDFSYLILSMVS